MTVETDDFTTPYQPLPGIAVGPHDSFVVDPDDGRPLKDRLQWAHHADRDVPHYNRKAREAGRLLRAKGGLCWGGRPLNHTATGETVETLTLRASLLCADCGRHGWLTAGQFRDLGNAHAGAPT